MFWSLRFLEFLLIAGAFGVIRRNPVKGLFVVVWFAMYGLFKGSNAQADFTSANWFRLAEPGLPAFILLAVGVAYCVPGFGHRVAPIVATAAAHVLDAGGASPSLRRARSVSSRCSSSAPPLPRPRSGSCATTAW